jgi:hypothetical protein
MDPVDRIGVRKRFCERACAARGDITDVLDEPSPGASANATMGRTAVSMPLDNAGSSSSVS